MITSNFPQALRFNRLWRWYKCDALYDHGSEMSIRWNDPDIAVNWPTEHNLLSEKDAAAPLLRNLTNRLPRYNA